MFRNLRERFGIDDQDYLRSMTKDSPKPMDSPGRSGAKFYTSHDKLYVIKTLTSEEVEQMHSLLKQYHPFIVERHGKYGSLSWYHETLSNHSDHFVVGFQEKPSCHNTWECIGSR